MTTIQIPKLPTHIVLSLWATLGFAGGLIALLTILGIAGVHDPVSALFPFATASLGVNFLCFLAGLTLGMVSLWGMYAESMRAQ